ncbi:hypothetical protein Lal_00041468, partial [Lupinus albus]
IWESEVTTVGLDNTPIEVWKVLGEQDIRWIIKLFNDIIRSKKMSDEWMTNILILIYKNTSNIHNCAKYRGEVDHVGYILATTIDEMILKESNGLAHGTREVLWNAIENKCVHIAYIRAIKDMYDGSRST